MRSEILVVALSLTLLSAKAVTAQTPTQPYWVLLEQANAWLGKHEYGQALQAYKDALAAAGVLPEAEVAIGDIYRTEGEFALAEREYQKAYNQRNAFGVPDAKYDVLYKLAGLYEDEEQYRPMEDVLGQIVSDDPHFDPSAASIVRTQIERNYFDKGLDHVLMLYRFDNSPVVDAHSKLGWFYYRTGRFSQSIIHLLYSVIYRVSQISTYLNEQDVDVHFTNLQDLMGSIAANKEAKDYAAGGLYQDLYYLAGSTFAQGRPEQATAIWRLMAANALAGDYRALSARQLKSPRVEPLLGATRAQSQP